MQAIIQKISIYNNKLIQITVVCNRCKQVNVHNISDASTINDNIITIDFTNLGKRCCDNFGLIGNINTTCNANYSLYKN